MEKIVVKNFAGIKSIEMELAQINVIIGPQASGKSIVAKLFYYFKSFYNEIRKGIINESTKSEIDSVHLKRFITYFPKESWPENDFSIIYYINDTWMSIKKINGKPIKFEYSDSIKNIIRKSKSLLRKEKVHLKTTNSIKNFELVSLVNKIFHSISNPDELGFSMDNQMFIPAGRSFFSIIQGNIFSFLSSNKSLDPFLIEFGSFYENFKSILQDEIFLEEKKNDKEFYNLINSILNSNYKNVKDKDYLIHLDKRIVNISNASSGQQEILPLIIVMQILKVFLLGEANTVLYIEEPEAHLSPNAQKMVVKLLARLFNSKDKIAQLVITTHSPYILSSFNNLMYAGSLIAEDSGKEKQVIQIIPQPEIIMPNQVIAYSLTHNKEIRSLIDSETNLISQNILDDVSNEISKEFGHLLDLEG